MNNIVIKFGGSLFNNIENRRVFFKNIKSLIAKGLQPIIVHGGGREVSHWFEKLGIKPKFVNGLRYTDEYTIQIVEMVLSGKVNKQLVNELCALDVTCIGISGRDFNLVTGTKKDGLGLAGEVSNVNIKFLVSLIKQGFVPVISSVSSEESSYNALNINADEVANSIAIALGARRLIFMTDSVGVLRDTNDEGSLIHEIDSELAKNLIEEGIIHGGMIPKVLSAIDATSCGVKEVDIIDGRVKGVISMIFDDDVKMGTRIRE